MKKHIPTYLFILVITSVLSMTSCTKESLKYCEPGVELTYFYELNKYYTNRFGEEVDKLSIYVFDRDELFYQVFVVDNPAALGNDNVIHLPLPAGDWHIVAWGGLLETYAIGYLDPLSIETSNFSPGLIPGVTTLESFQLIIDYSKMRPKDSNEVGGAYNIDNLYYGAFKSITTFTDRVIKESIPMMKNTQDIHVKIAMLYPFKVKHSDITDELFDVYALVRNGRYDFKNQIGEYARNIRYLRNTVIATG